MTRVIHNVEIQHDLCCFPKPYHWIVQLIVLVFLIFLQMWLKKELVHCTTAWWTSCFTWISIPWSEVACLFPRCASGLLSTTSRWTQVKVASLFDQLEPARRSWKSPCQPDVWWDCLPVMKSGLIHAAGPQSAWCPILAMGLRSSGRRGKPGGWDEGQLLGEWQWIQLTILTAEVRVGTRDEFLKRLGASHVSVDTKLDLSSAKSRVWLHSLFFTSIMDFNFLRISGINNLHLNIALVSSREWFLCWSGSMLFFFS